MNCSRLTRAARLSGVIGTFVAFSSLVWAQGGVPQGPPPGGPPAPATARDAAPVDLTGNWVSVITEDWRYRMMTPPKGEVTGLPVTPSARAAADAWDPAKDEANGLQCKAFGAPTLMRNPGRAQISWQDPNTLKIDYDTGQQTRLLHFGGTAPADAEPSWQGYSIAEWEREVSVPTGVRGVGSGPLVGPGAGGRGRGFGFPVALTGSLKVVTTHLRPGYLRKNGIPYSANAVLTEYFNHRTLPNGETWFTAVAVIEDPENLTGPLVLSSDFKKEPDGSKRMPMPCSVK